MGFLDGMKDAAKKGLDSAKKVQEEHHQKQAAKSDEQRAKGILMQLKSAEGMVTLFEDKVEIKNLLGSKVRDVPYSQITAVYMDKTSGLAKGTAAVMTAGMSLAVTNKKKLIISTGIDKFKLDFRRESPSRIKEATELINSKIIDNSKQAVTVNVQGAAAAPVSASDELLKLAELKEKGILTEEEFAAKKKQILGL